MIATQLTLISLIITTNALSLGTVSVKNVTKRGTNLGDLFPDWVPFKNKQGEELGEFVQVKNKPKKRLALPVNFILRAVAEPDSDDYYEKDGGDGGGGGGDGEDYFEKRDWSDTNRPVALEPAKTINHTNISEIDGVVSILTSRPPNPVVEALKKATRKAQEAREIEEIEEREKKTLIDNTDNSAEKLKKNSIKKTRKYEDEDYEDEMIPMEKRKIETLAEDQEKSENEAKKIKMLDIIDGLKQRHAKEQVAIQERAKEDEMYKEQRERENMRGPSSLDPENDKYDDTPQKLKRKYPEYDEYDEKENDKYTPRSSPERTKPTTPAYRLPSRTNNRKQYREKKVESGKLSVFKNPQLYMVYDEDSEETTTVLPKVKTLPKYSAKYTTKSNNNDNPDRISLVPEDSDGREGEPALFFPRKRNSKGRGKYKTTTPPNETTSPFVSEKTETPSDTTGTDATGSDTTIVDTTIQTEPTRTEIVPTRTVPVTDAIPSSTHHKESEKKAEDYHREKGGDREHHSEHENEHSEKGKKAYEGVHEETRTAEGYHDKENHLGRYDDHGGIDASHEEESGHYGDHHHEEHGKKHAKYEESGKHSKGHSTKGSHDIHKKEEYEKKVEFFEEDGDSAEEEKHGGFNEENGHSKGGHFKKGDFKAGHADHSKGDSGHFVKGGHMQVSKGHKSALGYDGHSKHDQAHKHKDSREAGQKWVFHHGNPAKTTNLVVVDRKFDRLFHGPQYYG